MDLVEDFIESILSHASPKYYDPVKAHEYYLRTRELSGRTSSLKTEAQKQAFAYSKSKIKEAQSRDLEKASSDRRAQLDNVRKTAELRRNEIRDKLNILLEKLTKDLSDESKAATAKIKALPPLPKGLSRAASAKVHAKRAEEIAQIRGEVAKDREAAGLQKKSARDASRSEVEQVRGQLKQSVESARTTYETLKKSLKAKYETETQQEFEAIKQNV